jgi:hypothetical protein
LAVDEYDDYVEPIARMLLADSPVEKIASYLTTVEVEAMGLPADHARARRVAERIAARPRATA